LATATKSLTIDDLISEFSPEEIKNALAAKQQTELQPRKDKAPEIWIALKAEALSLREIDPAFPLPWKSGAKKAASGVQLVEADLLKIQSFLAGETKPLKTVAAHLNAPWQTVKKYLKVYPAFKFTTKDGKAFFAYTK